MTDDLNYYLVTLKPIDSYFFGGKETFGEGADDSLKNYLVNSEKFPQQTTVLGMIRKELLKITGDYKSNIMDYQKENIYIHEIIGDFKLELDKLEEFKEYKEFKTDIGYIKEISPVVLYKKDNEDKNKLEIYTQIPFNYQPTCDKTKLKPLKFKNIENENKDIITKNNTKGYYVQEDSNYVYFNPKTHNNEIVFKVLEFNQKDNSYTVETKNINEFENFKKYSDIFIENINIGINISKNNKDNEDGYYKQKSYKLRNKDKLDEEWGFCFILSLKNNKKLKKLDENYINIVNMGAENSSFNLEIQKIEKDKLFDNLKFEENTITLMSDTYLANDDYKEIRENSLLIHTELKNFATINLQDFKHKTKLDNQYKFLKKGSVIHFENDNKLKIEKILNDNKYDILKKIGYNQYVAMGDKE
ncbi:type III-B CRISPR module-associated Cmr3 family protein [Methanococcus voltae]|uniref:CRISPR-associated protein, Cmr3 family n=1 Tax=Methanococcus voltae (strain ATCC BAA-1334 / A3) TaxID=456320 RepID=D7DST3_METV3|nr:type III-B CRISPR module-associated Cmr3 family protein [Methanococcus voltae]MCS3901794.1 CRISPR-associated protein Cmr3 [Methanococcus voltae]